MKLLLTSIFCVVLARARADKECGRRLKYYPPDQNCKAKFCNSYCSDLFIDKPCTCKQGCACPGVLLFNRNQQCVPPAQCSLADVKCPGNLQYSTCGCMNTCDKPLNSCNCKRGCFCPAGFVQSKDSNICVKPSECPQKCPENATYQKCKGCPKTCTNTFLTEPCLDMCLPGCVCNKGYAFDKSGKCIPQSQCPADEVKCPNNLQYDKCGGCVTTCKNYGQPLPCPEKCNIGCFCPKDLVYNNSTRKCVKPSECSATAQKCPENATFKQCKGCPKTCKTAYLNVMCPFICLPGCVCNDGYVFDKNGKCIPTVQCPKEGCPENASYQQCKGCPPSCSNMNQNFLCPAVCEPGCVCNKGYVFDKSGKCIPANQCPVDEIKCPSNLKYTTCVGCPRTCQNADKLIACTLDCKRGCQCPAGLYYNNATQSCVSKDECPKADKNEECMENDINSEYSTCGSCEPTCDDKNPVCTDECKIGCFCVKGFVKESGKCILPCNCPKILTYN